MVNATVTAVFLIAPLAILTHLRSKTFQLVLISICILVPSTLVSLFLEMSSFEMIAVAAAHSSVLLAVVSKEPNVPISTWAVS